MSEQPNVVNIDSYRVPEGTRFEGDAQVDLQKGDPRLLSIDAARAAVAVAERGRKSAEVVDLTAHRVEQARRVGPALSAIRAQEITDEAARRAA